MLPECVPSQQLVCIFTAAGPHGTAWCCKGQVQKGLTVSKATWLGGGRALWRWNSWMVAALAVLPSSSVLHSRHVFRQTSDGSPCRHVMHVTAFTLDWAARLSHLLFLLISRAARTREPDGGHRAVSLQLGSQKAQATMLAWHGKLQQSRVMTTGPMQHQLALTHAHSPRWVRTCT